MSYIVSIRRQDGRHIERAEVLALIEERSDFRTDVELSSENELLFYVPDKANESEFGLLHSSGEIHTSSTPSNAVIEGMQWIADKLGAHVIGEEGEDLTDVELPATEVSGAPLWGCIGLLLLIGVAFAVWYLL